MTRILILTLLSSAALLSACGPLGLAAGAGATVGIASTREGGVKGSASDFRIRSQINDLWFKSNVKMFSKLNLSIDQGRVLITGVVQDPAHRVEAVRLAWQPRGVKQVINEIRVADTDGLPEYISDTWITTKLRGKMLIDRDIQSINYSIDTVQGIVYLMGVARSQDELDHTIDVARSVNGVKQVISYVKLIGEPVRASTVGVSGTDRVNASKPITDVESSGAGNLFDDSTAPGTTPSVEPVTREPIGQ